MARSSSRYVTAASVSGRAMPRGSSRSSRACTQVAAAAVSAPASASTSSVASCSLRGGRVSAQSAGAGQGATFVLTWPGAAAPGAAPGATDAEPLARGPHGGSTHEHARAHTRHILVVEDDPHLAAGVVENLRAEGYEVDSVVRWPAGSRLAAGKIVRPRAVGCHVAGARRLHGLPGAARAGRQHAGALPHRARRSGRPGTRPRGRRRRLPGEALPSARAAAAGAGDPAPLGLVPERFGRRGRGAALRRQRGRFPRLSRPFLERRWRRS